uniref:Uncharacterized protein n=1 Tax=Romanomermis culicivorax TaxID=13658 RepID=A0A915JF10_ROMCU
MSVEGVEIELRHFDPVGRSWSKIIPLDGGDVVSRGSSCRCRHLAHVMGGCGLVVLVVRVEVAGAGVRLMDGSRSVG